MNLTHAMTIVPLVSSTFESDTDVMIENYTNLITINLKCNINIVGFSETEEY